MKIGYARVSTISQNLDLQVDALKEAGCEKIYEEKISGTKRKREQLDLMLSNLRSGDTVIVYKLDRLGRSMKHLLYLISGFQEKGISFRSINENISLDNTATGQLMFGIFAAFAQFERDIISERTKAGLEAARARGRTGGRPKGLSEKAKITAAAAKTLYESEERLPVKKIAERLNIAESTLYKYLRYSGANIGFGKLNNQ